MHREGFEPSHLSIVGLKSTALVHSAIDARNTQTGIRTQEAYAQDLESCLVDRLSIRVLLQVPINN